jgi:hypothetical protein
MVRTKIVLPGETFEKLFIFLFRELGTGLSKEKN